MKNLKQAKVFVLFLMIVSSIFTTGCDAEQIVGVINNIAQAVQQAVPAIQQVIGAFEGAFGSNSSASAPSAPAAPPEVTNPDSGGTTIASPLDEEVDTAAENARKILNEIRYGLTRLRDKLNANASVSDLQETVNWTNDWIAKARSENVEVPQSITDYYNQLLAMVNERANQSNTPPPAPEQEAPESQVGSIQQRIVAASNSHLSRYPTSGSFPYLPETNNGRVGCAQLVNSVFEEAGMPIFPTPRGKDANYYGRLRVRETMAKLREHGWVAVTPPPFQPGDVIAWNTTGAPQSHIGIAMTAGNTARAMSNSSSQARPRLHDANYQPIDLVLRKVN